jgi:hypothetical protein
MTRGIKKWSVLTALALFTLHAQASSTYRCASNLVSLRASTFEVQTKCGEPVNREFGGYREISDDHGFRHEVQIEEWVYGPTNGMYHFLRFEGNRLVKISSRRG